MCLIHELLLQGLNGTHPLTTQQHSSVPSHTNLPPSSDSTLRTQTLRTQNCPSHANGRFQSSAQMPSMHGPHQMAANSHLMGSLMSAHMQINGSAGAVLQTGVPMSHGLVTVETHGQTYDSTRSKELMQQTSDMLAATSHALLLSKQLVSSSPGRRDLHKQAIPPPIPSSIVDIVDVTDSVDASSQSVPESDKSLPFPVATLPFNASQ